jgi:hypothetical protein
MSSVINAMPSLFKKANKQGIAAKFILNITYDQVVFSLVKKIKSLAY